MWIAICNYLMVWYEWHELVALRRNVMFFFSYEMFDMDISWLVCFENIFLWSFLFNFILMHYKIILLGRHSLIKFTKNINLDGLHLIKIRKCLSTLTQNIVFCLDTELVIFFTLSYPEEKEKIFLFILNFTCLNNN